MSSAVGGYLPVVVIPTCCGSSSASIAPSASQPAVATKFHFALNVSDLERSIAFYRILFDVPPAKHYPDYAKFELAQPPLVVSLVPNPPASGGTLSYFGFPVATREEVQAAAARLAVAGLKTSCQEGTVCGYARQDKVWVADPDRNFWEIYVVHEDVDPETVRQAFDGVVPSFVSPAATEAGHTQPVLWEHRILMPFPGRIPHESDTVDEVRFVGTFNDQLTSDERAQLLAEVVRVLRPGGKLSVQGLVADRALATLPQLPGVAGIVRRVPTEEEPLCELAKAGFEAVRVTKLAEAAVFRNGAAEMREIKLEARRPVRSSNDAATRTVVYKGPFSSAVDEGQTFSRGEKTAVTERTWERLAGGPSAFQFLFISAPAPMVAAAARKWSGDSIGQDEVMSIDTTLPAAPAETRKFHFGLNVADIDRAVAFYRILFGVEPAKHFSDHAKFEVDDPPLILSLHPSLRAAGGALNHVGFRVASSEKLVAVQHRLEVAGIRTEREEGVECCYARQTKFWVLDADKNLWEIYTLEDDLDHSGFGGAVGGGVPRVDDAHEPIVWEHMLYAPLPQQIPFAEGAVDEIRLEGTFNADLTDAARRRFIAEVFHVLRPGGKIVVHGLVSDRPFPGVPALPGPAAMVRHIPVATAVLDELAAVGFAGLFYERLGDIHCFHAGGVELREMRLVGVKPFDEKSTDENRGCVEYFVLYHGPLAQVNEQSRFFPRGKRVRVDAATWRLFREAPFAEQFTCFVPIACEAAAVGTAAQARLKHLVDFEKG